jgi:lysophospholipid acyltransferase (LPLAT)-like uncharacterized protein
LLVAMSWRRRIFSSRAFRLAAGTLAAEYLRFVWNTSRKATEPPDIYERVARDAPLILAMWHGQHFLAPFINRGYPAKVLISRHRDGEINAIAAERLGIGTIRGSGSRGGTFIGKGGVSAFREMLTALEEGYSVAMTADIPTVAKVAGVGVVKLASASGRPIYPFAIATQRRIELKSWDRAAINLPFGLCAGVVGEAIRVPADADAEALESARGALESSLNDVTRRVYAIADGQR